MRNRSKAPLSAFCYRSKTKMRRDHKTAPLAVLLSLMAASSLNAQDDADKPSSRVRQEVLDQLKPVEVHASTSGITTLQFPARVQTLEGDACTTKPNEEAGDFAVSPGENWVSVKALKEGVTQNLNVIISGRVYPVVLMCAKRNDFSVLFRFANGPAVGQSGKPVSRKPVSDGRLIGLMTKLELYPVNVNTPAAGMYADMEMAEPKGAVDENGQVRSKIVRILRDKGLDSLAFEVQLENKGDSEYRYEPGAMVVRAGQKEFTAITGEGAGHIPPKGTDTAYFIVSSGDTSTPEDLSVNNDFHLVLK
jgi:hypothetical protein